MTRYAHQTGHYVSRRFGWDTHGLPIETIVDQKLNVKSKDDVLKMGLKAYNDECRANVLLYTAEWERIITRTGRWIDFNNDYKTMDKNFMESGWWVFKQLWDKGLVYRGFKVMPYSTACTTPLSNFETNQNYKDVQDPAIFVSFPIKDDADGAAFVAWTTTPWTLPSNLALCVNPDFKYVKVREVATGKVYVLLESRLGEIFELKQALPAGGEGKKNAKKQKKGKKGDDAVAAAAAAAEAEAPAAAAAAAAGLPYEVLGEYVGRDLVGMAYEPLFDYYRAHEEHKTAWRVVADGYVGDDSGTGIVHCAPAFGEDDYRVCLQGGVTSKDGLLFCPVDDSGLFTEEVRDFAGRYVKEADADIIRHLRKQDRVVKAGTIRHSYPFCWRSDTPLIYKAVPSWFIRVESLREKLLENNAQTYWVPSHVKEQRFHNWLRDARDWAVSRNRYWGNPLPVWTSEDGEEVVVVGSVAELQELSGVADIQDLHTDHVNEITIPSRKNPEGPRLRRVPEVFDCWFESGSMPYAQLHYPFENQEVFENGFPADFIAEGLDQTRGWFYTLMVLSTALFDRPAFKNLIVNGLVLAQDGKKMSKRLNNYPDPVEIIKEHSADALRLYLIDSPVVRAEPLRFKGEGVKDVVKTVFLPWYHAFRFLVENMLRWEGKHAGQRISFTLETTLQSLVTAGTEVNVLDHWILSALNSLVAFVHEEMKAYRLYTVVPRLLLFIDQLTNWYVRLNRSRFKGHQGSQDSLQALFVLWRVLFSLSQLMAPFTPFLTETMYQQLKRVLPADQQQDSVHYTFVPEHDARLVDLDVERAVSSVQQVIDLGRMSRDSKKVSLKQPLPELVVVCGDRQLLEDVKSLEQYVLSELNVKKLSLVEHLEGSVRTQLKPNHRSLGQRLGAAAKAVIAALGQMRDQPQATVDLLQRLEVHGKVELAGHEVTSEDVGFMLEFVGDRNIWQESVAESLLVMLDHRAELLRDEGRAREFVNRIQKLRKKAQLDPNDPVTIWVEFLQAGDLRVLAESDEYVQSSIGRALKFGKHPDDAQIHIVEEASVDEESFVIALVA